MTGATGSAADGPAYAGDVSPRQAWDELKAVPKAQLVDVRTRAEWGFVGVPDLGEIGKEPILLEWQSFPTMTVSQTFVDDLIETLNALKAGPDDPVYFLCRSGARSRSAAIALTAAGYTRCYNVANGFEGPLDAGKHRGLVDGWKAQALPWMQG